MKTNLEDLKKRATAGEIVLIDRIEALLRKEVELQTIEKAVRLIQTNLPPSQEDFAFDRDIGRRWVENFKTKLSEP